MRYRQCGPGPFLLVILLLLSLNAPPATAGITGSAHDFTGAGAQDRRTGAVGPLDAMGSCSACHIPHHAVDLSGLAKTLPLTYGFPYLLWPRNLTDEANYFDQYDSDPVYLSAPTLMCYDCHENQQNEVENPVDPDNWPTNSIYGAHAPGAPQDIALDDYPGSQGSGQVGYYEMLDGSLPASPAQSDATGGHYWKRPDIQLSGTPTVKQGEKLSCKICHDVHDINTQQVTGESQAMFRTEFWNGASWESFSLHGSNVTGSNGGLYSSINTRAHGDETLDANNHGRDLCTACHAFSGTEGTPVTMYGEQVPRPPTFISAHSKNDDPPTPCTSCHKHNQIVFRCDSCHGYPPMVDAPHDPDTEPNGYSADYPPALQARTAEVHARHRDALGTTVFQCEICHGPDPGTASWHADDPDGDNHPDPGEVDIMGESAWWDPDDSRVDETDTGYVGAASSETLQTGYEFKAKGGQDGSDGGRCFGLACHGDPPNTAGALNWSDDMVDDTTGAAVTIAICEWCHDATPAVLDLGAGAVGAPNAMGDGTNFGSRVNGHSLTSGNYEGDLVGEGSRTGFAAANKECTVCHDATYTDGVGPDKAHFDEAYGSSEKRLNALINAQAVTNSDDTCIACHQNAGTEAGTQISSHGNTPTPVGYIQLEGNFQRRCRHCHEPHGLNWNGTGRNLHMIGKWLDNSAVGTWGTPEAGEEARVDSDASGLLPAVSITVDDNAVIFTSRTGANSFNDTAGTPSDDICQTCHNAGTGGGDHAGTTGYGGDERGNDCTTCHDHDYDDTVVTYIYDAFLPFGAPDIEQFFDGASAAGNYNDVSAHPLNLSEVTLSIPEAPNCIGCHKLTGGSSTSNECLKCHYEGYVTGGVWTWAGHADGNQTLELRTASSTYPYTAACSSPTNCISINVQSANVDLDGTDDMYTHCLACHDVATPGPSHQLDGQTPPDIVPASSTWDGGFGHGFNQAGSLSQERSPDNAGPPAYDCRACHTSTVPDETDDPWPGVHASINLKLIANTTGPYQTTEYTDWSTGQGWCLTQCHRTTDGGVQNNGTNGIAKDDNVIDHTWAPDDAESAYQLDCPLSGDPNAGVCETHPSWGTIDTSSGLYQLPTNLPYDTASDQFFCVTCHEPHGNSTATDADQMIRLNYTDSTLCDDCHL